MSRMRSSHGGRRVRRQFSEEFKDGAVRLVLDEGKTVGAVARELDLTASALSLWVRHARSERTLTASLVLYPLTLGGTLSA